MLIDYLASLEGQERKKAIRAYAVIPPRDDDWLHDWVKFYMNVDIPRVKVCEDHVAPFTAFANAFFGRDSTAIWKASRGFGAKTFNLALLSLVEAITLGAYVSLLGGSGEQSQRVNAYLNGTDPRVRGIFMDAPLAPRWLMKGAYKRETRIGRGFIRALMASATSVRGPHPQRLHIDEVDEAEIPIIDSALGQPMDLDNVKAGTVISSTHQHPDGPMTHYIEEGKEKGWGYYEWCYRENLQGNGGWLAEDEVERKKKDIPAAMWESEYEGQEPAPDDRIFSEDVLDFLFQDMLGIVPGDPGTDYRFVEPGDAEKFFHGADWAKRRDWTVIHTNAEFKSGPDQLAAWGRWNRKVKISGNAMKWDDMVDKFDERVSEYGGNAAHDITGLGDVIDDWMMVDAEGVNFRQESRRNSIYSDYINACEAGEIIYPKIEVLYNSHKYLTREMLYGNKHVPDDVVSAALARYAKQSKKGKLYVAHL